MDNGCSGEVGAQGPGGGVFMVVQQHRTEDPRSAPGSGLDLGRIVPWSKNTKEPLKMQRVCG